MSATETRMRWKIAKELEDSKGIAWIRGKLAAYDWSQCEWITVRKGAWGHHMSTYPLESTKGWTNKVTGRCRYPRHTRSGLYRLNCSVNTRMGWPGFIYQRLSPLYRNEDGTWPEMPSDCFVGQWWISEDGAREWKIWINTEDEALLYISTHEAFHYLRRTRQLGGKNVEIEADAYAYEMLKNFRED
jgi:hypothetical protein